MADEKKTLVGTRDLAKLFGLSDRRIQQLVADGVITPELGTVNGKRARQYDLLPTVHDYVKNLQDKLARRDGSVQSFDVERARHEHIKIKMDEIRLALMEGKVHKAEDVEMVVNDMLQKMKSKLESIPPQAAPRLEGKDKNEIEKILNDEIAKSLEELSEYSPEDYYSNDYIVVDEAEVAKEAEKEGIKNGKS